MTDNTAEEFDVFDDDIDLDADETEVNTEEKPAEDDEDLESGEDDAEPKGDEETDEDAETPTAEDDKKESGHYEAMKAERKARQQLQAENEKLRNKYEPDEDEPDPVEDPEGYKDYIVRKTQSEFRQGIVNSSRERVMDAHDDATEKFNAFRLVSASDETVVAEFNKHPDPAKFAYDKGKEYLDGIYTKAYDKAKAELGADSGDKTETKTDQEPSEAQKRKEAAAKSPDLTGSTAVGANSEALETMEEDLFADSVFR